MPNPKRRHSKRRKNNGVPTTISTPLSLAECPNCHEKKLPHRACPHCGYYKGREVIDTSAKTA